MARTPASEGRSYWAESSEWLGLKISNTTGGGPEDSEGTVTFTARFRAGGQEREHVEVARFGREDGHWAYAGQEEKITQPIRRATPKIGVTFDGFGAGG